MGFIGFIKWFVFMLLCLVVSAEDEVTHIQAGIEEREFEMPEAIGQEKLSLQSFAIVYADGRITINDESMSVIEISAREAYNLLEVLYQHRDLLRARANGTEPQEEPKLWLMSEQEVEALAERMEDEAILREMVEMVACTIAEGQEVLEQEEAEQ